MTKSSKADQLQTEAACAGLYGKQRHLDGTLQRERIVLLAELLAQEAEGRALRAELRAAEAHRRLGPSTPGITREFPHRLE